MRRILIVGGSTRAAADSVRRCGWDPICADLFADLDLRQTADVIPVTNYPVSLPDDVAHVRADGWFYCGALENHPGILNRMLTASASYGPLLGTSPHALKFVRDPEWLAASLRTAGVSALDVASQSSAPLPDGTWMQKPLAGAGGRSIRVWDEVAARLPFREPHYFQRRASGVGLSAIFAVENGHIEWLGASRELEPNFAFQPLTDFAYCGSCGPLNRIPVDDNDSLAPRRQLESVSRTGQLLRTPQGHDRDSIPVRGNVTDQTIVQRQLTMIAQSLVGNVAGLKGLIGLDFRLDDQTVWLTEVNPRYTASVEVLELTSGRSFLNRNAFHRATATQSVFDSRPLVIVKQILYAANHMIAPDLSRYLAAEDPWQVPVIADIPMPGIVIEPGWPICTVLAGGENLTVVRSRLCDRLALVQKVLSGNSR